MYQRTDTPIHPCWKVLLSLHYLRGEGLPQNSYWTPNISYGQFCQMVASHFGNLFTNTFEDPPWI